MQTCYEQGISVSTLYRWYDQFDFNSANFGLIEYENRLEKKFGLQGARLFSALIEYLNGPIMPENNLSAADYGKFFIKLQELLACPREVDAQQLTVLGIFRTVLDRGS